MKRSIFSKKFVLLVVFVSLFLVTGVLAAGEAIQRFAVVSGGSIEAEAGGYQLSGALGQPVAGSVRTEDDSLRLCSGFWCGGTLSNLPYTPSGKVYLPFLMLRWHAIADAPNNCQGALATQLGELYQDDIDVAGDFDFYSFEAVNGSYTIEMNNASLNLYLYSPGCDSSTPITSSDTGKIVWPNTLGNGAYRILVQERQDAVGQVYILGVKKTP